MEAEEGAEEEGEVQAREEAMVEVVVVADAAVIAVAGAAAGAGAEEGADQISLVCNPLCPTSFWPMLHKDSSSICTLSTATMPKGSKSIVFSDVDSSSNKAFGTAFSRTCLPRKKKTLSVWSSSLGLFSFPVVQSLDLRLPIFPVLFQLAKRLKAMEFE